jgi:hypothetical protein
MADQEDSAGRGKSGEPAGIKQQGPGEELTAWFERELTALPSHMPPSDALQLLLNDLEKVDRLFRLNGHAGYVAAAKVMVRACFALGHQRLSVPFRMLANDLSALHAGMKPHHIQIPPKIKGQPKSRIDWDISVEACACLEILIKDLRLPQPEAEIAIAGILERNQVRRGRADKPTSAAIGRIRNEISTGKRCPAYAKERYHHVLALLRQMMERFPRHERRHRIESWLDVALKVYFANSELVPFNSEFAK